MIIQVNGLTYIQIWKHNIWTPYVLEQHKLGSVQWHATKIVSSLRDESYVYWSTDNTEFTILLI